jgi:glycosyltransferase involved in cell wall biosynthesis
MLWTILRHIDRSAIEPEVAFLSSGPFVDEIASLGIHTFLIPSGRLRNPVAYIRTVARLAGLIRRRRPEFVLSWSAKVHVYQGVSAALTGQGERTVWWQHAIATGHWLERLATLIPAAAVGCSSRACEDAQRRLRPRRPTFVVYPGVEVDTSATALTRAELGIPEEAWVIGVVGRLQPWKRQDRVIRAVAQLRDEGVSAAALVVGGVAFGRSVPYSNDLRALAHKLGVSDHVVFTGQVSDATRYLSAMNVLVNASDSEPFGIVMIEAMAAGLPVVANASGGPLEILEGGVTGTLVEDGDILAALRQLASNQTLATRLAYNARGAAIQRFSALSSASSFEEALQRLSTS